MPKSHHTSSSVILSGNLEMAMYLSQNPSFLLFTTMAQFQCHRSEMPNAVRVLDHSGVENPPPFSGPGLKWGLQMRGLSAYRQASNERVYNLWISTICYVERHVFVSKIELFVLLITERVQC